VQPSDGAAEERLLARARSGDLAAFNRLIEPHQRTLYTIAVRMLGDDPSAADVTQESLLAAWQHLGSYHGGSFRAWLTRILVNRCYDVLRTRRRRPERSYDAILAEQPETERLAGEAPDPEQLAVSGELGRHLSAGLSALPPDQRAIVILCDVQGYSYAEAAEVFGATAWQRTRYVTLPLLRPSLQVALILRTILAFQVFAVVIALAGRNLPVLAGEAYSWYGDNHNVGVAAGYSLLIMVFSLVNTGIYLRALRVQDEQAKMV